MKNFFKSIGKAALYFAVYFVVQLVVSYVYGVVWTAQQTAALMAAGEQIDVMALTEQLSAHVMDNLMLITLISNAVTLLVYWIRFAVRKKKFAKEVELKPVEVKRLLPVVIGAMGFNVIVTVVINFFPWPEGWMDAYMTNSASIDGSLISWISAVIMAPVVEEILFRGLIYTRLKKGMPTIVAAILASLVFGLVHGTIIWVIYAFVLGMVMTWVFERYQSLAANIIFHLAFNAMGLVFTVIPESAEVLVWVLFVAAIPVCVFAVKKVLKATEVVAVAGETLAEQMEEEACEV